MKDTKKEEFLRLFTLAQPVLRRYVLAHLPNFHQAEDALQEVSTTLWKKFAQYDQNRDFASWAFGIARNEVLRARRASARRHMVFVGDVGEHFADILVEKASEFDQRRVFLRQCIEKLPERSRRAIESRYRFGKATNQVADVIGSTVNAVRILLCRAREAIARCLKEALDGASR